MRSSIYICIYSSCFKFRPFLTRVWRRQQLSVSRRLTTKSCLTLKMSSSFHSGMGYKILFFSFWSIYPLRFTFCVSSIMPVVWLCVPSTMTNKLQTSNQPCPMLVPPTFGNLILIPNTGLSSAIFLTFLTPDPTLASYEVVSFVFCPCLVLISSAECGLFTAVIMQYINHVFYYNFFHIYMLRSIWINDI